MESFGGYCECITIIPGCKYQEEIITDTFLFFSFREIFVTYYECALTKATQLYLDGKDEFASERFFRGVYGDDYLVYIESTDLNTIGLSYRKPALPEGDLGVSVAEFQLDSMSREKLLEAMYTLTKILDA